MAFQFNGQEIYPGKPFASEDGTQYPSNWATVFTQDQKNELGITETVDAVAVDGRFYKSENEPKSLEDIPLVDTEGAPILDENGNQRIDIGLKNQWILIQKAQAAGLLTKTDWYVTRKSENNAAIPDSISSYRTSVRTISGTREEQINACTTVDSLAALVTNTPTILNSSGEWVTNTEPHLTPWPEEP